MLRLHEWNSILEYADATGIEYVQYTLSDGLRGLRFIVRDGKGNIYTTLCTGVYDNASQYISMIKAIVCKIKEDL